ncbi:MAG: hypothetical protein IKE01_02625 [Clostridia bacterium]|nr:hypothetical protein [Clostridia bacterium]
MNFEDCKAKIQKVSEIIEKSTCVKDILDSECININEDFQYLCLNSTIKPELVNETIASLAMNGKYDVVKDNIRFITLSIWKDVFNANDAMKNMFTENCTDILENAGILTYREIENFIDEPSTLQLVYDNLEVIIRKLCTYDRAALICKLKNKENGPQIIKDNLELFFQKGEFDISTTYSKILIELDQIPEITKIEILEACVRYLKEMLERETAIDNETNDLLNWVYDSMENTVMDEVKRAYLQENIDKAIITNFDCILDKTNYDKDTMKVLKLFQCTYDLFDNNKNMFIEKSNKLIHMTKIYDLNYEKENKDADVVESEEIAEPSDNIVKLTVAEDEVYTEGKHSEDAEPTNIIELNSNTVAHEVAEPNNDTELPSVADEKIVEKDVDEVPEVDEEESYEAIAVGDSELEDLNVIAKFNELLEKSKEDNQGVEDIVGELIKSNIQETDDIVKRVMEKSGNNSEEIMEECNNEEHEEIDEIEEVADAEDVEVPKELSLVIKNEEIEAERKPSFFERLWNKVKKFFQNFGADRIGE